MPSYSQWLCRPTRALCFGDPGLANVLASFRLVQSTKPCSLLGRSFCKVSFREVLFLPLVLNCFILTSLIAAASRDTTLARFACSSTDDVVADALRVLVSGVKRARAILNHGPITRAFEIDNDEHVAGQVIKSTHISAFRSDGVWDFVPSF